MNCLESDLHQFWHRESLQIICASIHFALSAYQPCFIFKNPHLHQLNTHTNAQRGIENFADNWKLYEKHRSICRESNLVVRQPAAQIHLILCQTERISGARRLLNSKYTHACPTCNASAPYTDSDTSKTSLKKGYRTLFVIRRNTIFDFFLHMHSVWAWKWVTRFSRPVRNESNDFNLNPIILNVLMMKNAHFRMLHFYFEFAFTPLTHYWPQVFRKMFQRIPEVFF